MEDIKKNILNLVEQYSKVKFKIEIFLPGQTSIPVYEKY
jgi:hypothetical protein|tara:strand:- start:125 stop:241 length:117 start_codon:yes stop_codon:yes gene_type:complete